MAKTIFEPTRDINGAGYSGTFNSAVSAIKGPGVEDKSTAPTVAPVKVDQTCYDNTPAPV